MTCDLITDLELKEILRKIDITLPEECQYLGETP